MNNIKPTLEQGVIQDLLRETFKEPIEDLEQVQGGEVAQTLSFYAGAQAYILRINAGNMAPSFQKEVFIFQNFASKIPMPPIVKTGRMGEFAYSISRRMPGSGLQTLSPTEYGELLPELIQTLYAIHSSDVSRWTGFSLIDDHGLGMADNWRSSLAAIIEEGSSESFFGNWHTLFTTSFLEREFFYNVYRYMLNLLDVCPNERYLVHGDFGFNNVLAHQGGITAVIDWINAQYGDFVYDIAWLDFWRRDFDIPGFVHRFYTGLGMPLIHYNERISCYKAYIGLNAMRFYAKIQNQDAYRYTRHMLESLLSG